MLKTIPRPLDGFGTHPFPEILDPPSGPKVLFRKRYRNLRLKKKKANNSANTSFTINTSKNELLYFSRSQFIRFAWI